MASPLIVRVNINKIVKEIKAFDTNYQSYLWNNKNLMVHFHATDFSNGTCEADFNFSIWETPINNSFVKFKVENGKVVIPKNIKSLIVKATYSAINRNEGYPSKYNLSCEVY